VNNPTTMNLENTTTKWQPEKHTQQPNGSSNTTGRGYPPNCKETINTNAQRETLHKKNRAIIPISIQKPQRPIMIFTNRTTVECTTQPDQFFYLQIEQPHSHSRDQNHAFTQLQASRKHKPKHY
jgi:hypothetical protein